ncbi:hypothetical protein H0H93_007806 [Arthromyces matolae]|nr:hypothetical protein H0H93_007806 [Arthromyces matolae]
MDIAVVQPVPSSSYAASLDFHSQKFSSAYPISDLRSSPLRKHRRAAHPTPQPPQRLLPSSATPCPDQSLFKYSIPVRREIERGVWSDGTDRVFSATYPAVQDFLTIARKTLQLPVPPSEIVFAIAALEVFYAWNDPVHWMFWSDEKKHATAAVVNRIARLHGSSSLPVDKDWFHLLNPAKAPSAPMNLRKRRLPQISKSDAGGEEDVSENEVSRPKRPKTRSSHAAKPASSVDARIVSNPIRSRDSRTGSPLSVSSLSVVNVDQETCVPQPSPSSDPLSLRSTSLAPMDVPTCVPAAAAAASSYTRTRSTSQTSSHTTLVADAERRSTSVSSSNETAVGAQDCDDEAVKCDDKVSDSEEEKEEGMVTRGRANKARTMMVGKGSTERMKVRAKRKVAGHNFPPPPHPSPSSSSSPTTTTTPFLKCVPLFLLLVLALIDGDHTHLIVVPFVLNLLFSTWTRDELLKNLEIIGILHDPFPPTLPPSPPVSRSNSPAPPLKRRYDAPLDHDRFKRPRTGSMLSERPPFQPRTSISIPRNEPSEDGEVREDPPVASSSRIPPPPPGIEISNAVPIRRPRRGRQDIKHHDTLHDKYHNAGRLLKYSGDARFWSTYAVSKKEYRPLANPPPPNSMYHKYGGLIARLELVDALVCFTYAIWNKDYARKSCNHISWTTTEAFLTWCKQKWLSEEVVDAERSFIGLIYMIEGFIHARKAAFLTHSSFDKLYDDMRFEVEQAANKADQAQLSTGGLSTQKPQATPPMLPSPASIAPTNSANSTPITRDECTPPNVPTQQHRPPIQPGQHPIRGKMLPQRYRDAPVPAHTLEAMLAVSSMVNAPIMQNLKEHLQGTTTAAHCLKEAQTTLNLSTLVRFFPTTFARVMHTTLHPSEEHEPDLEDEEGELSWPGQSITGEGLGWVCLLGKAMIKEFGKAYGYKGLDGVVPKPNPKEASSNTSMPSSGSHPQERPGSTPHGHTPHGHTPHGYSSQPPSLTSSTMPR